MVSETERETFTCASQTNFLEQAGWLVALSLATLLDLRLTGKKLPSQVRIIGDQNSLLKYSGPGLSGRYVIVQMDNGNLPLNLREVTAYGIVGA